MMFPHIGSDSCGVCKKDERDDEDGEHWIQCEGSCQRWFHLRCLKLKRCPKGELKNVLHVNT